MTYSPHLIKSWACIIHIRRELSNSFGQILFDYLNKIIGRTYNWRLCPTLNDILVKPFQCHLHLVLKYYLLIFLLSLLRFMVPQILDIASAALFSCPSVVIFLRKQHSENFLRVNLLKIYANQYSHPQVASSSPWISDKEKIPHTLAISKALLSA